MAKRCIVYNRLSKLLVAGSWDVAGGGWAPLAPNFIIIFFVLLFLQLITASFLRQLSCDLSAVVVMVVVGVTSVTRGGGDGGHSSFIVVILGGVIVTRR